MTNALRVLVPTVLLAACGLPLAAAEETAPAANPAAAAVADELMTVDGGRQVRVLSKKDITIPFKTSEGDDLASVELWYSSFDGVQWGQWTKHPFTFPRDTPVTWSPAGAAKATGASISGPSRRAAWPLRPLMPRCTPRRRR